MRSLLLGLFLFGTVACSAANEPPVLGDPTAPPTTMTQEQEAGVPCSTPQAGCPCQTEGQQEYCGVVYRISGNHVDCSKGYVTCMPDGKWSACEGAKIFDQ